MTVEFDGQPFTLAPEDVFIGTEQSTDWGCGDESGVQIAVATKTTPELEREGTARDFIRQVQQLRKEADLQIQDRIAISCSAADAEVEKAVTEWTQTIQTETLAASIVWSATAPESVKPVIVGQGKVAIWIARQ